MLVMSELDARKRPRFEERRREAAEHDARREHGGMPGVGTAMRSHSEDEGGAEGEDADGVPMSKCTARAPRGVGGPEFAEMEDPLPRSRPSPSCMRDSMLNICSCFSSIAFKRGSTSSPDSASLTSAPTTRGERGVGPGDGTEGAEAGDPRPGLKDASCRLSSQKMPIAMIPRAKYMLSGSPGSCMSRTSPASMVMWSTKSYTSFAAWMATEMVSGTLKK